MKTYEIRAHFVTYVKSIGENGWQEVGLYVDPVLSGASRILIAVMTHPCKGAKWTVHSASSHEKKTFRLKRDARKHAFELCVKSDAGQIHAKSDEYREIFSELY